MMRLPLIAAALVLAGCATAPAVKTIHWSRAGATYEDYLRDRYACLQESRVKVSEGGAIGGLASYSSGEVISAGLVRACLSARGYAEDAAGFGPPPGATVNAR